MKKSADFCHHGAFVPPMPTIRPGVIPLWSGHQRTTSAAYRFDGMRRGGRRVTLWQYTLSGLGMVEYGGRHYPVRPGEAFLLTLPEPHCYRLPETPGEWEFIFLGLAGPETERLTEALRRESGPVSARYGSPEAVRLAWRLIRGDGAAGFTGAAAAAACAAEFMLALIAPDGAPDAENSDFLPRFHQFCMAHLGQKLSVAEMAEFSGYSRSHFCRLFRNIAGKGPHEYLLELRLQAALRRLREGDLSVKETAEACGFSDSGYFCRLFRRFYGATPAHFRWRARTAGTERPAPTERRDG